MTAVLDHPLTSWADDPFDDGLIPPDDDAELLGATAPRLYTPPLVMGAPGPCGCGCALDPSTSLGFEAVAFARHVLGIRLLPWQRWWLIHAFELRAGTPLMNPRLRFRTIVTLISRQNGKTTLLKVVSVWLMYSARAELILGAAQTLEIAKEAWSGAVRLALDDPELADLIEGGKPRYTNGDVCLTLMPRVDPGTGEAVPGARYKITATTPEAGRGLSVDLLILDELRAQYDMGPWAALSKTTSARRNGLIVAISNAGSDRSVVLNALRAAALTGTEDSVGLMEWSAPDGCDLDDVEAWQTANPALGRTLSLASLRTSRATDDAAVFRTECLCQRVSVLDGALDPEAWLACVDPTGSLARVRDRVALCVDVSMDGTQVVACGAAVLDDGRVRVDVAAEWGSMEEARRALPALVKAMSPIELGWFPAGPAAAIGADLRALRRIVRLAAVRVTDRQVIEQDEHEALRITGAMDREACQGLAQLVDARMLLHAGDRMINSQVANAQRWEAPDGSWRFVRKGVGNVAGIYAVAGAVYLARVTPRPTPRPRSQVF